MINDKSLNTKLNKIFFGFVFYNFIPQGTMNQVPTQTFMSLQLL